MKSKPKTLSALIYVLITVDKICIENLSINNNVQKCFAAHQRSLTVGATRMQHLETKVIPKAHGKHFAAVAIVGKRKEIQPP